MRLEIVNPPYPARQCAYSQRKFDTVNFVSCGLNIYSPPSPTRPYADSKRNVDMVNYVTGVRIKLLIAKGRLTW